MKPKSILRPLLFSCGPLLLASSLHADNGTWTADSSGNWSDTTNWNSGLGPFANGTDFTALFDDVITANRIVTLDSSRTIGNVTAADTTHNYTIQSNTLTLDVTSGSPTISVAAGRTLTISSVVAGADGFTKTGDGTAILSGANTIGGDVTVSGGVVEFDQSGNRTFDSLSGSGDFRRREDNTTLSIPDASAFTGNLRTFAGGNSTHTIEFGSLSDAVGAGNLQFGGGTGDSNQRTTMRLYGDVGPLTLTNRSLEILPKNPTPSNWSARATQVENNNATAANKWVINSDLINITDRNHELELKGSNTGDNEFAGDIGDSTAAAFYSSEVGRLSLIKSSGGKWILSGANTYTGSTTIVDGALEIRGAGQLGAGGVYPGNITNTDTTPSPFIFDSSANTTISGTISGGMAFIKDGAGTLALTGSALHTGGTTAADGTLSLGDGTNHASLSDFGTLSVDTGATLDLNFSSGSPDSVLTLSLGGSPMAVGQYGHTNSGANNGGAGVGFYDAFFEANTGIINNLNGDITPLGIAFWDGGTTDPGVDGNAASDGGTGTWDDTILNWDYGTVAHAAWLNTAAATANFGGNRGTVTLGANMNIENLNIEVPDASGSGYFIGDAAEDNTLTFGGDKTITVTATGNNSSNDHTIRAGIAGAPTLDITGRGNNSAFFALEPPTGVTQTLGQLNMFNTRASNKQLRLGGGSTGNVVDEITWSVTNNQLQVLKSATVTGATATNWTVNQNISLDDGAIVVAEGSLIFGGTNNFVSHFIETQDGGRIVLRGNWRIHDEDQDFKVLSGGTVAPGGSVGTVTFNWNSSRNNPSVGLVDLRTGSTYEWEVGAGVNNTDVIAITEPVANGNAELVVASGTTLKVVDSGGSPVPADKLTVFTCASGVVYPDVPTLTSNMTIVIGGTTWTGTPSWGIDVDGVTGDATIYITGIDGGGGPANPYDTWIAGFDFSAYTSPDLTATGNPDGDAFTNLQEFAFGFNPAVSDGGGTLALSGGAITQNGPPQIHEDPVTGQFFLRYTRRTDYVAAGLAYTSQFAADSLGSGSFEDVAGGSVVATGTGAGGVAIEAVSIEFPDALPLSGKKARFGRVEVTQTP
jgi:autotransporter-associated beta strand protein